jgi:hypothetical protein
MHTTIERSLKGLLIAGALVFTAVGAVTPGEARGGGGGGHGGGGGGFGGGGGGGAFVGGGGFHGGGLGLNGVGAGFHGGGLGFTGSGAGFHGGVGGYEARDTGGIRPGHPYGHGPRGVYGNRGGYGFYGDDDSCNLYLANPKPPYCQYYPY